MDNDAEFPFPFSEHYKEYLISRMKQHYVMMTIREIQDIEFEGSCNAMRLHVEHEIARMRAFRQKRQQLSPVIIGKP